MKAISILSKEHELIKSFIGTLELVQEDLEEGKKPEKKIFELGLFFSKQFTDRFHHFKEEYLLFGLLAHKKKGELDHSIGALRHQHERCKTYLSKIENSLDGYADGNEISTTILLENLASYISILKRHIFLEDHVFFKMACAELTDNENGKLMQQFTQEEVTSGTTDLFEECRKLVLRIDLLLTQGSFHDDRI